MSEKREQILWTAAQLFHKHGYHNVGIKQILDTLSIPKGSFYHYFDSKETLMLEIISLYVEDSRMLMEAQEKTIEGLSCFFESFFQRIREMEYQSGCPVGNLILELADEKESFRFRLLEWHNLVESWIESVLLTNGISDAREKAKVMMAGFEGSMMMAKLVKNDAYLIAFQNQMIQPLR